MQGRNARLKLAQVLINETLRKLSAICDRASAEERANALLQRRCSRGSGNRRQHRGNRTAALPLAMYGMKSKIEKESPSDGQRITEPGLAQDRRQLETRGSASERDTFGQHAPCQGCAARHHRRFENRAQSNAFGYLVQDDGHGQRQPDTEWRRKLCGYQAPAIQRAMNRRSQN